MAVRAEAQIDLARVDDGAAGQNGATFTPSVDVAGDISWTNDGGLPNPPTQNIMGPPGTSGPSITDVKTQYYLSTSDTSATGGSWSDTPQTFVSGKYYWTREYTTYSDSTHTTSTPVYNQGLTFACEYALSASDAADEAKDYAENASEYAARALGNLSTLQSVAETLTWIAQHGTMALTTDVALDPTHVYFVVDAGGDYVVGGVTYAVVTEPDVDDIGTYYELSIDESLNNYVGTHLALDSEGLWLLPASSGTDKVLIATGAGSTYTVAGTYIVDSSGATVASFRADGETLGISDGTESYITLDYHSMQMIDQEGGTYFHVSDLRDRDGYITESFVGDGTTRSFTVSLDIYLIIKVKVNGTATTAYTQTDWDTIQFTTAPANNADIEITYEPQSAEADGAKAFTLGTRDTGNVGIYSYSEGFENLATGKYSHAEGRHTVATGYGSHAEGGDSTISGYYTTASGFFSHAEGSRTEASGDYAHAEGHSTTASGDNSHSEGYGNLASGDYAHAEGVGTKAQGDAAHAEGNGTEATGEGAHAEGGGCWATGDWSHAGGYHNWAASDYQSMIGKYGVEDSTDTYGVIVGNGTSDVAPANALMLGWDGNVFLALDTSAGSGTDHDLYSAITALGWGSDVIV